MLVDAEASVHMEREHLSELLQVSPESLNPGNLYDRELIPIRSPIDGVVIARNISVGQVVDTGFVAFDISNLSTVWVTAAVNQQDLSLIQQGARRMSSRPASRTRCSTAASPCSATRSTRRRAPSRFASLCRIPAQSCAPACSLRLTSPSLRPATPSSFPKTRCRTSTACPWSFVTRTASRSRPAR